MDDGMVAILVDRLSVRIHIHCILGTNTLICYQFNIIFLILHVQTSENIVKNH